MTYQKVGISCAICGLSAAAVVLCTRCCCGRDRQVRGKSADKGHSKKWSEPRLGLELVYDERVMRLKLPVHRRAPFAVLEFDVANEEIPPNSIGAAVTVQVHDCSRNADAPPVLEEYVSRSLAALEEMEDETLATEHYGSTTLGGLPAIHFCYYCADGDGTERKVYSCVAALNTAVYSVSYSSTVASFKSMRAVQELTASLRLFPPAPSDSSFVFTDPKYGISLQVPVATYHVESTPVAGGRSWREVVQFSTVEKPEGGASIIRLDAEPADLPVLDCDITVSPTRDRRHKCAQLRYAAQLYRQQVIQDRGGHAGDDEVLWARLDVNPAGVFVPDEKGRRVSRDIVNSFTRSLVLKTPEPVDAVAFAYHKTCPGNTTLCFIVYMWLQKGDLFVLSSVCHSDQRLPVAQAIYNVANTMRYGEKHGQTSSLKYFSRAHSFSVYLPTQLRAFEPFIGDPYVISSMPSSSKVTAQDASNQRLRLLREFYMQVRILDRQYEESDAGEGLEEMLVNEMGELAGLEAVVHSSKVTRLAGYPALEVIFTADMPQYKGCGELALPPAGPATTLRMITVRQGLKFVLEFVGSVKFFPHLASEGIFAEILGSFAFEDP